MMCIVFHLLRLKHRESKLEESSEVCTILKAREVKIIKNENESESEEKTEDSVS